MTRMYIFADNQLHPCDLEEGQHLSFVYRPQGRMTRPGKEEPVADATVERVSPRTVTVQYLRAGGLFGNRLVTWRVILLRRMGGTSMDAPVYRLDDTATGLNIGQ